MVHLCIYCYKRDDFYHKKYMYSEYFWSTCQTGVIDHKKYILVCSYNTNVYGPSYDICSIEEKYNNFVVPK